jgi:hypothetical protein
MTGKQQTKTLKNLGLIPRTKHLDTQFYLVGYLYMFLLGVGLGILTQII